jgi:hypothetical protein
VTLCLHHLKVFGVTQRLVEQRDHPANQVAAVSPELYVAMTSPTIVRFIVGQYFFSRRYVPGNHFVRINHKHKEFEPLLVSGQALQEFTR